jgi:two-component system sensor histidine kinase RegB
MAQGAGTVGESVTPCSVGELIEETLVGIRDAPRVLCEISDAVLAQKLQLPPRAVSQALRSLVTNAQDASPPTSAVVVTARIPDGHLEITIRDRGAGIPQDVKDRIGEPFFTTKEPGRGMGLGLFLARAVIEAVGGALQIDPLAGGGTEVRVQLPMDVGGRSNVAAPEPVQSSASTASHVVSKPV